MNSWSIPILLTLSFAVGCTDVNSNPIVGEWETNIEHSDGTWTQVVTQFRGDGTFSRSVVRGSGATRQPEGEPKTENGTWTLADQKLRLTLSTGLSWVDEVRTLDDSTLYVATVEGADPVRRGVYVGSHRR